MNKEYYVMVDGEKVKVEPFEAEEPNLELIKHIEKLKQEKINAMGVSSEFLGVQDKRVKGTDFPEVMNIFNELLDEWYQDAHVIINDRSVNTEEDQNQLYEEKMDYIKRFKEALGVER